MDYEGKWRYWAKQVFSQFYSSIVIQFWVVDIWVNFGLFSCIVIRVFCPFFAIVFCVFFLSNAHTVLGFSVFLSLFLGGFVLSFLVLFFWAIAPLIFVFGFVFSLQLFFSIFRHFFCFRYTRGWR